MFSKQNLLATLVAGITIFILGFVIWGVALADFFASHAPVDVMRGDEEMNLGIIFLGNICAAFAMSTIYGKWARGYHSAKEGLQYGAWIGVFVGLGMGLLMYGTSNTMDSTSLIVEIILDILFYAVIGMIIALIYKATAGKKVE